MIIKCFTAGQLENNMYLVIDENTKKAVLIDASALIPEITDTVKAYGADVEYILLTHGHFDHIMGLNELKKALNAKAAICHDDLIISDNINEFTRLFGGLCESVPPVYEKFVIDGDIINVGDIKIKVIHTPGHTKGGSSIYCEKEQMLFSGDTLFKGMWGRTDLPTSSFNDIIASISNKLLVLPDETIVYPGHGISTRIVEEEPIYYNLMPGEE